MKTLVLVGLGLLAIGCGSSDSGSKPTLDGVWQVQLASGCTGTYEFKGSTYSDNVICTLTSGGYGVEIESGTFTNTGSELDFTPTESSCPPHSAAGTDPYSLQGNQLVLTLGAAQVILEKVTVMPVSGGAVVQDGCWDLSKSPASFTPGAIQML